MLCIFFTGLSGKEGYTVKNCVAFFAMKPSSGRRACTGGHLTAKEIERNTRDAAMKLSRDVVPEGVGSGLTELIQFFIIVIINDGKRFLQRLAIEIQIAAECIQ